MSPSQLFDGWKDTFTNLFSFSRTPPDGPCPETPPSSPSSIALSTAEMQSEPQSSDDSDASDASSSTQPPIKKVNTNFNQNEFLPDSICKQIVHSEAFGQLFSGELADLSTWIQQRASKLFLIFAHMYRIGSPLPNQKIVIERIRQLYEKRVEDSVLPFTCKCGKRKFSRPCEGIDDPVHEVFWKWDRDERREFLKLQRMFKAPVFRKEEFIYELDEENILPIRALSGPKEVDDRGCFSEVERLEMKIEHQNTFDKVSRLL
jgi:hypothetical protein